MFRLIDIKRFNNLKLNIFSDIELGYFYFIIVLTGFLIYIAFREKLSLWEQMHIRTWRR